MITSSTWVQESSQAARMVSAVPRWLSQVPLYRQLHYRRPCWDDPAEFLRCFSTLPFTTKEHIRQGFPRNFLPESVSLEGLLDADLVELEHTSGTSEEPMPLLLARGWWNEQERQALELNPFVAQCLQRSARRVAIVSPVCSGDICYTATPGHSERMVEEALFVNLSRHPFLWTEASLMRMVRETLAWEPVFLDVDPVYGVLFARYCEHHQIRFPSLRFILASYEFVSQAHRRVLERVFQAPVFDLYGSTETGHLLMENERGKMTPQTQAAFLEVVEADADGIGELVVTTLTNEYMPLLRYRIGDLVKAQRQPYHTAYELHGRARDAVTAGDGRRVTVRQLDRCLDGLSGVIHYQLRQDPSGRYTFYWVPDGPGLIATDQRLLEDRLSRLLGTCQGVNSRPVDYIPCESSGKFRLTYRPEETEETG